MRSRGRPPEPTSGGSNPSAPSRAPGVPENPVVHQIFGFEGLNYKAGPTHIGDQEALWCHNLHPIAPGKLRAMPDVGAAIYDAGSATILGQPQGYNLGPTTYAVVLLDDYSVKQVQLTSPYTVTEILPAGSVTIDVDFTQWGSSYLIIVSNVTNGYWIWDGSVLYKSGTIGPKPVLLASGVSYTAPPTITTLGGSGTGATFSSTIQNGGVATIRVTNPGSGWLSTDPASIALLFDNGSTLRSAHGHATISDGVISSIVLDDGGHSYTSLPTVTVTDGGAGTGTGADIIVSGVSGGILTGFTIKDGGFGYGTDGQPTISFSGGGGSGAEAHAVLDNGVITAVTIDDAGLGYLDDPVVSFISATGAGATGTALLKGHTIDSVDVTAGGSGYSGTVNVVFTSSNGPAHATVNIMPYGVDGISVATFQQRVWVSHYPTYPIPPSVLFSDADDPANFGPPGGAFPLTQEYLRYRVTHLVPSGSFLYVIGDSSIGYVAGVQTSGTPAVTTFSVVNIDPQTGTPWRDSVYTFGQTILMVNDFGIYRITGGTVQKASDQIDDLMSSGLLTAYTQLPSTAVGQSYGVRVFGVLWPIVDPTTNLSDRLVIMSDGKRWWTYKPSVTLEAIFSSEIDSIMFLWGHDGKKIYPMFNNFTTSSIEKKYRTKLFTNPSMVSEKRAMAAYVMIEPTNTTTLVVKPVGDTALGSAITPGFKTFNASNIPNWDRTAAQGAGRALGWEITSTSPYFTIDELIFVEQEFSNSLP